MGPLLVMATALALGGSDGSTAAAAHRAQFAEATWYSHYYANITIAPPELRDDVAKALQFTAASCSRERLVEYHVPQQIEPESPLYHLDLVGLKWDWRDFNTVLKTYPYRTYQKHGQNPLVIHPGWLIAELADANDSPSRAYYLLLYGSKGVPKNRDDFLRIWKVDNDPTYRFGWVEGQSGVSNVLKRWLEHRPQAIPEGYAWGTRDVTKLNAETDPGEHFDGSQKHDAEEWIVALPKQSYKTGERGALQAYLLNDDEGKIQDVAPASIVDDKPKFRGTPEIENWGSCVGCHPLGINAPTVNEWRQFKGEAWAKQYDDAEQVRLFHNSDEMRAIGLHQAMYARGCKLVNGLEPEENARVFERVVRWYDADVSLEQAARELYTTPDELQNALGIARARGKFITRRLADLANDVAIPRVRWEEDYYLAYELLVWWQEETR